MKTSVGKKLVQFFIPLITLGLILVSCNQEELIDVLVASTTKSGEPIGKKVGDLIIDKSTVILDPNSLVDAKVISEDLLVFKPSEEQTFDIVSGAILVGARYNGETVENVMGRVQAISVNGDIWSIKLSPVELEEFILEGSISGSVELKEIPGSTTFSRNARPVIVMEDIPGFPSYNLNQGIQTKTVNTFPRLEFDRTFEFPKSETTVGDAGGSFSLKAGFTPVVDYNISFKSGVSGFKIVLYAKDIILDSRLKAYAALRYNQSVADAFPIPIAPIALGPTGLIISPTLGIGPFLNMELSTALDIKLFHVEGDISYELTDLSKKPVFNLVSDPYSWNENLNWNILMKAETGLECRAGIGLLFGTLNLASVGASAKLAIGMDMSVYPTNKASFEIYGLGQASADIKIGPPPFYIYSKYFPLASWRPVIYNQTFTW